MPNRSRLAFSTSQISSIEPIKMLGMSRTCAGVMVFQPWAWMNVSAAWRRSLVTTSAMVMLSSIWGKRPLAPSRTQASFCASISSRRSTGSSTSVPVLVEELRSPTVSASRPANMSMRLLPAPIWIGGWGRLHGLGVPIESVDTIVLPVERHGPLGEQSLQHRDRLGQPADAHARRVKHDTGPVVLSLQEPRAKAELEAATREQVERRRLFSQDHRMAVVIVDHEGPHPHGLCRVGRGHERRERRELVTEMVRDEMVADEKRRVP